MPLPPSKLHLPGSCFPPPNPLKPIGPSTRQTRRHRDLPLETVGVPDNPGNTGRAIQLATLENSPFTLVSFFTSTLCCNDTARVTVRGFNAANAQVAFIVITDRFPQWPVCIAPNV